MHTPDQPQAQTIEHVKVANMHTLREILQTATKPVVIRFIATFCRPCHRMTDELKKYNGQAIIMVTVDVTETVDVKEHYGIRTVPYCMVVDSKGGVVRKRIGFMYVDEFVRFVDGK